jgi:hypothetical protein
LAKSKVVRLLRQERERGDVTEAHDPEVAVVQGGPGGQVEPLGQRDHRSVDRAQRKIGIGLDLRV